MKQLIGAIEGLLMAAALTGGDTKESVKFALKSVKWRSKLTEPSPLSQPVVDLQLDAACAVTGQYGSNSHMIVDEIQKAKDLLHWESAYQDRDDEPDIASLTRNFAYTTLIGPGAPLHSDKVAAGLSLQGRDTYYPPHAHQAVEGYWIVGGDGDWKVGAEPWFPVKAGSSIFHDTGVRHAMQSNAEPLLTVWMWTSHLESEIVIVRG